MRYAFLFVALSLAGCDKLTPKKPTPTGSASTPVVEQKPESKLPQTLTQKYQGRDAESWAADLYDREHVRSQKAAIGLSQIGPEGLRFFVKGMKHDVNHVRSNSTSFLPFKSAKEYKEVFLPLLVELLADSSENVRYQAASKIVLCNFKEALPDLRKAEEKETHDKLKIDLGKYIKELESKKSD